MVLVGAEGVVENGGIINKLGTFNIAIAAAAHNVPLYCAAESYKFARLYPLDQRDFPMERKPLDLGPLLPRSVRIENPSRDYTPPSKCKRLRSPWTFVMHHLMYCLFAFLFIEFCFQCRYFYFLIFCSGYLMYWIDPFRCGAEYISLLFTDLGVLTPAAVSDELIQLYV